MPLGSRAWGYVARSLSCSALVACVSACEEPQRNNAIETVPNSEPSPNASLLPDPLPAADSLKAETEGQSPGLLSPPVPFSAEAEIPQDELLPTLGEGDQGYDFTVRILGPRRSKLGAKTGTDGALDLVLGATLFTPGGRKPERLRLVLVEGPWLLPLGTEVRARADRLGHVLVWPDGRSYRVVPVGSLLNLFGERRADVMPRFSPTPDVPRAASGVWSSSRVTLKTPMGQLRLDTRPAPSPGDPSGHMLCRTLLELIRARGADVCVGASFAREAELTFEGGPPLKILVSLPTRSSDLHPRRFLVPPEMPIFKPGEYPPGALGPLTAQEEAAVWSELGLERPTRPEDANIVITNGLGLPVLLSLFGEPLRYLGVQEAVHLKSQRPVPYQVESLLGMIRSSQGRAELNSDVLLGGTPEVQALGKPRVEE
jgi:hypothetical protein